MYLRDRYRQAYALCLPHQSHLPAARQLLLECVTGDPGNLIYVETFLQVLAQLTPQRSPWRAMAQRFALDRARRHGLWQRVLQLGPRLLTFHPSDRRVLCALGEASQELGHRETARLYWTQAARSSLDHATTQRLCAEALERLGSFEQAEACWRRVNQLASASKPTGSPGSGQAVTSAIRSASSAPSADSDFDPADAHAACAAIEAARGSGDFESAQQLLRQAIQASPADLRLVELSEDLQLERAHRRLEWGQRLALSEPGPAAEQLLDDLRADLARQEIAVYEARSRRFPADPAWKLHLARSLKHSGNFAAALEALDSVPEDGAWQCETALERGECWQYQRQFTQALALYEQAAQSVPPSPPFDALHKQALYRAGVLALQLNDFDRANRYLEQLAQDEAGYKDLAGHLDKIRSIRHKDGFSYE